MLTRALLAVSDHRHLVVAAGVLLLVAAVWCGVQSDETTKTGDDDGFAELDGYDPPSEVSPGTAVATEALALPPSPSESTAAMPLDLGPVFAEAGITSSAAPVNAAYFVSTPESAATSPVWLMGTIETVDDVPEPFHESAIRYTRSTNRGESARH